MSIHAHRWQYKSPPGFATSFAGTSCLLQSIFLDVYRKLFILVKFFVHARWTSLSGGTAFLLNPADSPNCGFICNNIRYRHSRVSTGCVYTLWKVRKSTQLISGRQRGIYYTSSITCSIMQDAYSAARTRTPTHFFSTRLWLSEDCCQHLEKCAVLLRISNVKKKEKFEIVFPSRNNIVNSSRTLFVDGMRSWYETNKKW